jgi:hypothetical protein
MMDQRQEAIKDQVLMRDRWHCHFVIWVWVNHILTISVTALSALVAAKPKLLGLSADHYDFIAFIVAVASGLAAVLKPSDNANRIRRAWSVLTLAITRYRADQTYTLNHVLSAYERGENIIHETPQSDEKKI